MLALILAFLINADPCWRSINSPWSLSAATSIKATSLETYYKWWITIAIGKKKTKKSRTNIYLFIYWFIARRNAVTLTFKTVFCLFVANLEWKTQGNRLFIFSSNEPESKYWMHKPYRLGQFQRQSLYCLSVRHIQPLHGKVVL